MNERASGAAVELRFYAELNHFIAPARRGRDSSYTAAPHESLKHSIESLGVPHTEVARVLVNGEPVDLDYRPREGDRISVFPVFRTLDPAPAAEAPPRFIADAQLGRLARYLRFAGFDTLHADAQTDAALVEQAQRDGRIVLTRDRALLMHRALQPACHVRDDEPLRQLAELAHRLRLDMNAARAARCMLCNTPLDGVDKAEVQAQLPARTAACFDVFWRCPDCRRVYWRGSHWRRLRGAIEAVSSAR